MIYFIYFSFSLTSYSPQLLGRKITLWAFMNVPPITIPNFRPKYSKSIPVFRPKRLKNHTLWGGAYLYTLYRGVYTYIPYIGEYPPPPDVSWSLITDKISVLILKQKPSVNHTLYFILMNVCELWYLQKNFSDLWCYSFSLCSLLSNWYTVHVFLEKKCANQWYLSSLRVWCKAGLYCNLTS